MKVLLGVTGGVAAKLTPKLVKMFAERGHEVKVVVTEKALYFFPHSTFVDRTPICAFDHESIGHFVPLWTDKDEWTGCLYQKDQSIPHIALTQWADVFALVPLTANTIGKIAGGICDNLLTSEVMAWPLDKPLVLAPAMNTVMWKNPIMQANLKKIRECWWKNWVVPPVTKRLACGDVGDGALADLDDIVRSIEETGKSWVKRWTKPNSLARKVCLHVGIHS